MPTISEETTVDDDGRARRVVRLTLNPNESPDALRRLLCAGWPPALEGMRRVGTVGATRDDGTYEIMVEDREVRDG